MIFGSDNPCEIDSIIITNRTSSSLLLDITILREIEGNPTSTYLANKIPIIGFGKQEVVNLCINNAGINYTETILRTQEGDTMFANSDFINNTFDCIVTGRRFTELPA